MADRIMASRRLLLVDLRRSTDHSKQRATDASEPPMIEFRTLGRLELTQDGRELVRLLSQPKRLALLAYLAVQPPGQYSRRDRLLAMFWPELDAARARHCLSQALHRLGSELGRDALERRGGEELRLRPAGFWCDAAAFEEALDAPDPAAALELYRGDFLDGVFLPDAGPFEHWVDALRQRLRERASAAASALADDREAAGNPREAAAWARRAAVLMPFDEGAVQRLIRLLDRVGDRATAVRAYEEFATRLDAELEIEPAPETMRLVNAVRSRRWAHATAPAASDPGLRRPPRAGTVATAEQRARATRADGSTAAQPSLEPPDSRPQAPAVARRVRRSLATALALAAVSLGFLFWPAGDRGSPTNLVEISNAELEAHELYLRGRFYRARRDATGVATAIGFLEEAVRLDPRSAEAHAALAKAYAHLGAYSGATDAQRRDDALLRARTSAVQALAIDPTSADAHVALALHHHWYDWDWHTAETAYRQALALEPSSPGAHQWYALLLLELGRVDEALSHMRRARELDPLSIVINRNLGYLLYCARRTEEAIAQLRTILDLDPDSPLQHAWLRNAYLSAGAYDEAFDVQLRHAELRGWSTEALTRLRAAYAERGWPGAWEHMLRHAEARQSVQPTGPTVFARLNAELGRLDEAFDWLERAYRERSIELLRLKADPIYDALRDDPRYHDLLARMALD
jgi:DNA-binding SARP family transcriptional activator/Tfp pilus assembly protein PilF